MRVRYLKLPIAAGWNRRVKVDGLRIGYLGKLLNLGGVREWLRCAALRTHPQHKAHAHALKNTQVGCNAHLTSPVVRVNIENLPISNHVEALAAATWAGEA